MFSKKKSLSCLELSGILTKARHSEESKILEKSSTKRLDKLQSKHPGTSLVKLSQKFVPIPELGIYTADQHVLQNGTFPQHCYSVRETINHQKLDKSTIKTDRDTNRHQKFDTDTVSIARDSNRHQKLDNGTTTSIARDRNRHQKLDNGTTTSIARDRNRHQKLDSGTTTSIARDRNRHQKLDKGTISTDRDTNRHQKQQLDSVNGMATNVMDNHNFRDDLCSHSLITCDSNSKSFASKCHVTTHPAPQTYHSITNISSLATAAHKRTNSLGQQFVHPANQKPKNKGKEVEIVKNARKQQIIQPIKTLETVTNHKQDPPKKTRSLCDLRTGLTFSFVDQNNLQIETVLNDVTDDAKLHSSSSYKSSFHGSCNDISLFQSDKSNRALPFHKASLSVYHAPEQQAEFGKTQTQRSSVAMETETRGNFQKQAKQINLERLNERQTSSRKTCSPNIHLVASQWRKANSIINISNSGSPPDHHSETEISRLKIGHSEIKTNRLKNGRSVSEMKGLKIDQTGANRPKHDHSVNKTIPNDTAENKLKFLKHTNHRCSKSNEILSKQGDNSGLINTFTDSRKADNDKTDHKIFTADSHCTNSRYSCYNVNNNCDWTNNCRMSSPCCRQIFSESRSVNFSHGLNVKHPHNDKTTDFGVSCSNDGESLSPTQNKFQQNAEKSCDVQNKQYSNIHGLRNNEGVRISLFDLTQKFDLVPVLVQLPQGIQLKDVLQLKEVSISKVYQFISPLTHQPSEARTPHINGPLQPSEATMPHINETPQPFEARMPHIGKPASAFTPVKPRPQLKQPATLGQHVLCFSNVKETVHEYTSVGRAIDGDIICEVNGAFCLESDCDCLKEVVESCRGVVTFTVARAKLLHQHKLPDQEDMARIQELECDVTRLNILIHKREEKIQDLQSAALADAAAAFRNLLNTVYTAPDSGGAPRELFVCDVDVGYEEYVV